MRCASHPWVYHPVFPLDGGLPTNIYIYTYIHIYIYIYIYIYIHIMFRQFLRHPPPAFRRRKPSASTVGGVDTFSGPRAVAPDRKWWIGLRFSAGFNQQKFGLYWGLTLLKKWWLYRQQVDIFTKKMRFLTPNPYSQILDSSDSEKKWPQMFPWNDSDFSWLFPYKIPTQKMGPQCQYNMPIDPIHSFRVSCVSWTNPWKSRIALSFQWHGK